jgi:hypothetical protein
MHEHALEIESLLNRLISLSFARQLHEHFFPGSHTEALSRSITELSLETRADTVAALRHALDFVRSADVRDERAVQRFAVSQALSINARDHERRRRSEELWQHLNLRGATLMARRGVVRARSARSGWAVAGGS